MPSFAKLNHPWFHFVLIGLILFLVQKSVYPEPKPTVGPLAQQRIAAMQQKWVSTFGGPPSEAQMEGMVRAELDRDMMFQRAVELELHLQDPLVYRRLLRNLRFLGLSQGKGDEELFEQALDMRLHLSDEVIKQRLVQIMEQQMLADNSPTKPTEEEIAAEFASRREELRHPPRYSIEHVYFAPKQEPAAPRLVRKITELSMTPEEARQLSSRFLPGHRFMHQTPDQLTRIFGPAFVKNLQQADAMSGQWLGPIRSAYGLHYVFVLELVNERDANLEEVRALLLKYLESRARNAALAESIATLRGKYQVIR